CRLRIGRRDFERLSNHLFPGDQDEHGAVLLADTACADGELTLYVREVHLAQEGVDYVRGTYGYRALSPKYIHRLITRARDERLGYLAVHNHGSDREVGFSFHRLRLARARLSRLAANRSRDAGWRSRFRDAIR